MFLSILLVWSGLAILGQALFQLALTTAYSDQLQPCELTVTVVYKYSSVGSGIRANYMCVLLTHLYAVHFRLCVLHFFVSYWMIACCVWALNHITSYVNGIYEKLWSIVHMCISSDTSSNNVFKMSASAPPHSMILAPALRLQLSACNIFKFRGTA